MYWNPYDESREVADNENLLLWSDQRSHDSMLINLSLGVTAQIVPILVSCNHALVLRKVANTQYMLRALMIENTRPKPTLGYESVTRDVEVIFHECPQNK